MKREIFPSMKSVLLFNTGIIFLFGMSTNVLSQSGTGSGTEAFAIEEVIVTARKREENAISIPESITAFGGLQLERNGIEGLSDIGNLVPNMYMSVRADGFPNVSIRGLGAFGNTQGVGFYIDDVQVFSGISSRVGDLERIEVLKGPQGILYGGSNIGGAVKFVTKRPDPGEFGGHAKIKVGTDNYYDGEFSLNVPLSEDWAVRMYGYGLTDDSFLTNPNTAGTRNNDPDIGSVQDIGGRIALAGNLTDRLSVYTSVRFNDLDSPNNFWIRELDPDFEYPGVLDATFNPRHKKDTVAVNLELNYDFDNFTVTSISSYSDSDSTRTVDIDLSPDFILDSEHLQDYETITQELRIASDESSAFQWLAGAYYMSHERTESSNLILPPLVTVPFRNYDQSREQLAAFMNLTYRWENLEISGGMRVDRWESYRLNFDSNLLGQESDTEILFRGSLAWYFDNDNSMLYSVVSQGIEPGGFNLTNFTGAASLFGFGAEDATNYEIGYKGRLFDDRVKLSFAGFYIDYNDRQFELQVNDPNGPGIVEGIINAGDSTQWGIEGDIVWQMHENWALSGGFGYIDSEWDDGMISPVNNFNLSGLVPPQTPEWSGTMALDYNGQLSSEVGVFGRLQAQYKGSVTTNSQFVDVPGDDFPMWENPSFTVVDLSIGATWRSWEFVFLVENLLDEDYYIDAQEFPNFNAAIPQGAVIIGTPEQTRRFSVSMEYRF